MRAYRDFATKAGSLAKVDRLVADLMIHRCGILGFQGVMETRQLAGDKRDGKKVEGEYVDGSLTLSSFLPTTSRRVFYLIFYLI